MSNNVSVDGELDMGWKSYWDSGETVAATDGETGENTTDFWPDHINPGELSDTQRRVLKTALTNPTLPVTAVEEKADVSAGYGSRVLRQFVPDWYEEVFKSEHGKNRSAWSKGDSDGQDGTSEPFEVDATVDTNGSSEDSQTDVEAVVEILKETAVHDETENALEVIEEYL